MLNTTKKEAMIDAIIFDLDGTLWDSRDVVAKSWSIAVEEVTGENPHFTSEFLTPCFGKLLPDIAAMIFPGRNRETQLMLIDKCTEVENKMLLDGPGILYPNLESTLEILSANYPLYIVSNCQGGYIEVFLESTGLTKYFKDHLCPGDTGNPKADNITAIKNKHHLTSPVYVGDTTGDYDACIKSNTPFVYASYGFGDVPDCTATLNSFDELPDIIKLMQHQVSS
ncbi:MAG: HAD family hydrolase [Suipraeoptans sp.]